MKYYRLWEISSLFSYFVIKLYTYLLHMHRKSSETGTGLTCRMCVLLQLFFKFFLIFFDYRCSLPLFLRLMYLFYVIQVICWRFCQCKYLFYKHVCYWHYLDYIDDYNNVTASAFFALANILKLQLTDLPADKLS